MGVSYIPNSFYYCVGITIVKVGSLFILIPGFLMTPFELAEDALWALDEPFVYLDGAI